MTTTAAQAATTITLQPTSQDRRESYGLLFESTTTHEITGSGVHNHGSQHKVQVWMSKPSMRRDDEGKNVYRDCDGEISERGALHFRTSAQASMLASTPVERPERGETLRPGDLVDLGVFGTFRVETKWLHDPILVEV